MELNLQKTTVDFKNDALKEKLSLIEDSFIALNMLVNLNLSAPLPARFGHNDYFDKLMDMTNEDVLINLSSMHAEISLFYKSLAGFKPNESPRINRTEQ